MLKAQPSDEPPTAPVPASSPSSCVAALQLRHGADVRVSARPPAADEACVVVDPVEVVALAVGGDRDRRRVLLQPPAILSCEMASVVAQWVETTVHPLAKGHFGRDLVALRVGGGHECRRRNRGAGGPMSEHAKGRALDVFGFEIGEAPDRLSVSVRSGDQPNFLAAIRQSACGAFATTLGPGSDAAHADHLHVDIKARNSPTGRFCQ
ncbi:extensin family protein [Bosea sp. (in: a-proteobacteria)]|uniref:extensin-like domain-containing protein n=1 Tax=Bosea sp. (in: a-proteobacteria) TaxID=1871050 RepID=UPI00276C3A6B|nr:extensin family protein [Bosea sp. (in: a-proteobacteria)]